MSVLKQPFQMLPFSPNIEFQFRLRSDCFNDICDVPIIPKGKFIPFAIIADSDDVGQISLLCWDAAFEYERSEMFYKEGCANSVGSGVIYSKTYYSTLTPEDAQIKAFNDANFYVEGQSNANLYGICKTNYLLNSTGSYFLNSTGGKFKKH